MTTEHMDVDCVIVYTDCDLRTVDTAKFVTRINELLLTLNGESAPSFAFQSERHGVSARWVAGVNIGVNMWKPSEKALAFLREVRERMTRYVAEGNPQDAWDQQVVNRCLLEGVLGGSAGYIVFPNGHLFDHWHWGGGANTDKI